jgi:tRNA(Ile)-lysidine synthase
VNKNLQENSNYINKDNKLILNKIFFEQPYEIIFRSISEAIKSIGKKYHYVRGKKLDKIIDDIINNESFRVTLGGCIIEKVSQSVIISKEH